MEFTSKTANIAVLFCFFVIVEAIRRCSGEVFRHASAT
jgi:hypothetical protein